MKKLSRLKEAVKYLKSKGYLHTQKDICDIIKADKNTVSQAIKGNPDYLTDKFLKRFCDGFPIINCAWLQAGVGEMLQIEKKEVTLQPEGTQMEFDFNKWIELENKKTDVAAKNADSMQALVGNNTTLTQTNETLVSMLKEALRDGKDVDKKIDAITAQMEGFLRPSSTKPVKDVR